MLPGQYDVMRPGQYHVMLPGQYDVMRPGQYHVMLPGQYDVMLPGQYHVMLPGQYDVYEGKEMFSSHSCSSVVAKLMSIQSRYTSANSVVAFVPLTTQFRTNGLLCQIFMPNLVLFLNWHLESHLSLGMCSTHTTAIGLMPLLKYWACVAHTPLQ